MDPRFYISLFLRRLPHFLIWLALGSAIGLTLAVVLPAIYKAEARLVVEAEQIPDDLAASTVRTAAFEQLQIIQQRVLTREKLLELANRLKIYAPVDGRASPPIVADEVVADLRERIQIVTTGGVEVRNKPTEATLVAISFTAPTAALSATVVNEVVTMILQENVKMRTTVSAQTLQFFVQEVSRLDQELAKRGAEILAFRQKNIDALPDSLEFRRAQHAAAQTRLEDMEREEAKLRESRDRLVARHDSTALIYAPDPVEASAARPRAKSAYDLQLAGLDAQIADFASQKAGVAATIEMLRASIDATPGNATTLDTLERDYANIRAQYDVAAANKARAETGDMIEAMSKGQRITVIEQAVAPVDPDSPNRPRIAAAGIGGGLAVGLGFVLLLELLNSAIRRPVDLTSALGITTFATLPLLRPARQIRRRRLIIASAFGLVFLIIPSGLWTIHTQVLPLDLMMESLMQRVAPSAPVPA